MQTSVLIEELKKSLALSCKEMIDNEVYGDLKWTQGLKKALCTLGSDYGYKVCTSTEKKDFENEWLYDLVWYKEDGGHFLIDVPLVVESEWKKNLEKDIKFD